MQQPLNINHIIKHLAKLLIILLLDLTQNISIWCVLFSAEQVLSFVDICNGGRGGELVADLA